MGGGCGGNTASSAAPSGMMLSVDEDARSAREQVARLASHGLSPLYSVSGRAAALRGRDRSETRGAWRGNSGAGYDAWRHTWSEGGAQMTFGQRLARESAKLYEELKATPPLILLLLSCLALLLVGAILVGASR